MNKVKQIIVMRNDLNMRKGKMIAQGSHASMAFLLRKSSINSENEYYNKVSDETIEWMNTGFTKICVQVSSENELDEIYNNAINSGLTVELIVDSGRTEFNGVPTKTCLAIGPHSSDKIDVITGKLKLL